MAYSSRSSYHPQNHARPHALDHERASVRRDERRTPEREVVQSDELSSTSGARMISSQNPYDPSKNPHASTALPRITADHSYQTHHAPGDRTPEQPTRQSIAQETPTARSPQQATPHPQAAHTHASHAHATRHAQPTERKKSPAYVPYVSGERPRRRNFFTRPAAIVLLVAVIAVGGFFTINHFLFEAPVQATVNGETMTLEGKDRTIEGLLDDQIVTVSPGNYVAVDNSVLRAGEGTRCTAVVNDQQVEDLKAHINEGDQVVISDGSDLMEEYSDSEPTAIPAGTVRTGDYGALHVFLPGEDGEKVTRTGNESGISIEQTTKEKVDSQLAFYNANTNGEKVVALTFDDGPWDSSTEEILNILKEHNAKATFYTIGQQIPEHSAQIERMAADGHEIATHTWDHADGSGKGVSLDLMSTAERKDEVTKGLAVIEEVSGKEASTYFRAPGGNFGDATATDLQPLVSGEIGWNIDTEDWTRPGAEAIAERIKSVKPGGIILMHDGGGDRSQTVEALRDGLAYLDEQGYEFITISELIERYPYQQGQNS